MTLRLFIKKKSDTSFSEDYEFKSFPIFLGRDNKNEVVLPDSLKIISRKHAKILEKENSLMLTDLESANFTYLNGEKIEANKDYNLLSGDRIKIGEYEIEAVVEKEESIPDDNQKTMLFNSPFAVETEAIAESIRNLCTKFSMNDSPMKEDMLKFSLFQSFSTLEKNEPNRIIAEFFSENFLDNHVSYSLRHSEQPVITDRSEHRVFQFSASEEKFNPPAFHDSSFSSHFAGSIDLLLETFARLLQGFLQFRQEFFGVTIYQTIPVESLSELKSYLFNPSITPEEEKKRIKILGEEIQNLMSHQIGLLEGYKISVTEGSKALLQSLNPEAIEQEIQKKNIQSGGMDWGKIIPAANSKKILLALKENYKKYISDPLHVEKKFFRPFYLKGYQKRSAGGRTYDEY